MDTQVPSAPALSASPSTRSNIVVSQPSTQVTRPRRPWMRIFLLLLLGSIGGFLFSNSLSKPTPAPQPSIVPATPIPTTDPTANWKTINGKYWVFKVPFDWNYLECKGADATFVDPKIKNDQITECNFEPEGLFSVSRIDKDYPVAVSTKEGEIYTVVSNKENIFIDNTQAIQQQEDNHGGQSEGTYIRIYVKKSGITYLITLSDITKKEVFDQILSTFKFLGPSGNTVNWKHFAGQGISFNYPNNLLEQPYQTYGGGNIPEQHFTDTKTKEDLWFRVQDNLNPPIGQKPYAGINDICLSQNISNQQCSQTTIQVDNQPALDVGNGIIFLSPDKSKFYDLQYSEPDTTTAISTFKQVLATFKFAQ